MISLMQRDKRGADHREDCGNDYARPTLGVSGVNLCWVGASLELQVVDSSLRSSCAGVGLCEISGANWEVIFDSQALDIRFFNSVAVGPSGLSSTWSGRCPGRDSSLAGLDSHRVFGVDSFNLAPTYGVTLGGINDCQTFIKEDHFGFNVEQDREEKGAYRKQAYRDRGKSAACVPTADVHSDQKEEKDSNANKVALGAKDNGVASANHVVIVAQKVRN